MNNKSNTCPDIYLPMCHDFEKICTILLGIFISGGMGTRNPGIGYPVAIPYLGEMGLRKIEQGYFSVFTKFLHI